MKQYTLEDMLKALKGSMGIIQKISERAGCTRATVYNWIEKSKEFSDAIADEREAWLDKAEVQLGKKIDEGNERAIEFFLERKGRNRGYANRQELTGADGQPLGTKAYMTVSPDDFDNDYDEETGELIDPDRVDNTQVENSEQNITDDKQNVTQEKDK